MSSRLRFLVMLTCGHCGILDKDIAPTSKEEREEERNVFEIIHCRLTP